MTILNTLNSMMPMTLKRTLLSAAAAALTTLAPLAGPAFAQAQATQPATAAAPSTTLDLAKTGLRLLDAQGRVLDERPLRAKRWDQRLLPDGRRVALVQDADSGALHLLHTREGKLQESARWDGPGFNLESLCLYLEPRQQLLQALLVADDGLAEQWLLDTASATRGQVLRRFAAVPDAEACAVRDAEARLYLVEPGVGLWSFSADPERADRRLVQPGLKPEQLHDWLAAHPEQPRAAIPVVVPSAQTEPVRGQGDAADDPALWLHPTQPGRSLVLGTDKKRGLSVYDLQGREVQFLPSGRLNNVDVRQRLRYAGRDWDLAVATQRDERSVHLFQVQPGGRVRPLASLPTGLDDVYGICSARNPQGGLDIFVNDKDGRLLQLRLSLEPGQAGKNGKNGQRSQDTWSAVPVASHQIASQPEGCVADEAGGGRAGQLFIGEEKRGLWKLPLDAQGRLVSGAAQLVLPVGELLHADVEGMAVHRRPQGPAYLVVSSQGNDSFVVLDADAPHAVRGRFRVGINTALGIDAVSETDGLDVTSANLGGPYQDGLLVVQDGHKRLPQGRQNFKLVPWRAVANLLKLD